MLQSGWSPTPGSVIRTAASVKASQRSGTSMMASPAAGGRRLWSKCVAVDGNDEGEAPTVDEGGRLESPHGSRKASTVSGLKEFSLVTALVHHSSPCNETFRVSPKDLAVT